LVKKAIQFHSDKAGIADTAQLSWVLW